MMCMNEHLPNGYMHSAVCACDMLQPYAIACKLTNCLGRAMRPAKCRRTMLQSIRVSRMQVALLLLLGIPPVVLLGYYVKL